MSRTLRSIVFILLLLAAAPLAAESRLTLMTFNTWGSGLNEGKPVDETLAVLRAAGADIIGLQETRAEATICAGGDCPPAEQSVAVQLAAQLGFHVYEQRLENAALWANAILSRYPIIGSTPHDLGVIIDVDGHHVAVFNIHLTDFPYQPYQLLGIPYGEAPDLTTAEEAVRAAQEARGPALELLLADIDSAGDTEAAVIFGDFNEPSYRDWSARAVKAGRHPLVVPYPFTRVLEAEGFIDAMRAVYPDEVAKPAYTWTPTTRPDDPADHHDRIDFIFVRGAAVAVEAAAVVGEKAPEADLVVTPWPSDHRAVRAVIRLDVE